MIKHNLNHLPSAALLVTTTDTQGNYESITVLTPWEFTRGDSHDKGYITNFGHMAVAASWGTLLDNPSSMVFTGNSCANETLLVTSRELAIATFLNLVKDAALRRLKKNKIAA